MDTPNRNGIACAKVEVSSAAFFANLATCLIGMEACGSTHYWARKLQVQGHNVSCSG